MNLERFQEQAQQFIQYCERNNLDITPESFEAYHQEQMSFIDKMLNKEGGLSEFGNKVANHLYKQLVTN